MSDKPLVTAIVPTYKRPHLLDRSVGSILKQTYRPLELIVVDDESGDDTQEKLATFEPQAESAGVGYRYFEKENGGPGPARNYAMQRAEGSLIAFLDDDDQWYPEKVEKQVSAMQAHPEAGASFTQYVHAGHPDRAKPRLSQMEEGWVFESLCRGTTRAHIQTLMITKESFELTGGFGTSFQWEDTEFELRLALHVPFIAIKEPLTVITPDSQSISRESGLEGDLKRDLAKLALLENIIRENRDHPRFKLEATRILRARLYDEHIKHLLWLGRVKDARTAWHKAATECGEVDFLMKLRRKLFRATVAGWFGRRLRKPE